MAAAVAFAADQSRLSELVLPHTKYVCCTGSKQAEVFHAKASRGDDARERFPLVSPVARAGRLLRKDDTDGEFHHIKVADVYGRSARAV